MKNIDETLEKDLDRICSPATRKHDYSQNVVFDSFSLNSSMRCCLETGSSTMSRIRSNLIEKILDASIKNKMKVIESLREEKTDIKISIDNFTAKITEISLFGMLKTVTGTEEHHVKDKAGEYLVNGLIEMFLESSIPINKNVFSTFFNNESMMKSLEHTVLGNPDLKIKLVENILFESFKNHMDSLTIYKNSYVLHPVNLSDCIKNAKTEVIIIAQKEVYLIARLQAVTGVY